MRFSQVSNRVIYQTLAATAGVTAVVGNRIFRGLGYPSGTARPACLFYMEQSVYDAGQLAGFEHVDGAQMRYVVRFDDVGMSDASVAAAADAAALALHGQIIDTDDGYTVTFTALGEAALASGYIDGDTFYQQMGDTYRVDVTRG